MEFEVLLSNIYLTLIWSQNFGVKILNSKIILDLIISPLIDTEMI